MLIFDAAMTSSTNRAASSRDVPAVDGSSFWGSRDRYAVLVLHEGAGGTYAVVEATIPPGGGPAPHFHRGEQESLYVLHGSLQLEIDHKPVPASAGAFVHIPCGTVHGFRNAGDADARVLLIVSHVADETWCDETPEPATPPTRLHALLARYRTPRRAAE